MTENTITAAELAIQVDDTEELVDAPLQPAASQPVSRRHSERGLTTVEYAIGIALIIAIIGAMVLATHQGFFTQLVQDLFKALFATVIKGMGLG
ncbi:hypothetical protein [Propioniciclava sp.]|uniref:hypothetical protein n=1 Tax=Propioniciclava sp. TaxID=2038686 RepID=UPI002629BB22|nr:hypothetical protein [Propioniciclava sp.]